MRPRRTGRPTRKPLLTTLRRATVIVATVALAVSGCGASSTKPRFNDQGGATVPCMVHQKRPPDAAYGGPNADPLLTFKMLHYYTANGRRPFCDGRPPTSVDRMWLHLYVDDGAEAANLGPNLG